jgi:hypothetical protein
METKFEFKSILWQARKEGRKEGKERKGKDPVPPDSSCWVGSSSALHIYYYYYDASPWIFVI